MIWFIIIVAVIVVVYFISKSSDSKKEPESIVDSMVADMRLKVDKKYVLVKENFDLFIRSSMNDISENKNDPTYDSNIINVAVKGLYYRNENEKSMAKKLIVHEELFLEREPDNKIDPKSIKVLISKNIMIGYVEEKYSDFLTRLLDNDYKVNCFVSKITNNYIPYIYMEVFFSGHKTFTPKELKQQKKQPEVVYVDYKQRISRLKENIKRSQVVADNATKENIRDNALKRIEEYRVELANLEKIRDDNENN